MAGEFRSCCVEGCNGDAANSAGGRRGLCVRHYWRWKQDRPGPACSVEGCATRAYAKGYCVRHWSKWSLSGNPLGVRTPNGDPKRFFSQVALRHSGEGCLIWPYARDNHGYARMFDGKRMKAVHRIVCEQTYGAAPTRGHHAAHSCGKGNEGCVSPQHLRWATVAENMADRLVHGTSNRGHRQGQSRLTESDVREIRSLVGQISHTAVAQRFGVSPSHISKIASRRTWSWLE